MVWPYGVNEIFGSVPNGPEPFALNKLFCYYEFMTDLIFKVKKAEEHGRSGIEIILKDKKKISRVITEDTDKLLGMLDKLLKRNKIELESLNNIKVETTREAGLTSQRIVKSIVKALSLNL
ncbi:MAG: hypothetical protein A2V69_01955 [Candidatus Portnoybacteria bacterium RBG_13_40_8]|uniref:Uncharacterized protein n=1 Tax=Candidatus Portnoybacteria bacterium RBG_13_40_8 TaxID=1801990 RepID=A0A1G2F5C5_9BACT|nr:MAG: hypothetical protein A2V69_01955 [Candidatus Portnoybacteria bacterium RBG_13_40_8]